MRAFLSSRKAWFAALIALMTPCVCLADPAEFYRGRTVRLIVDTGSGEGYDAVGRLVARYLGNHLPGNPRIVVENMPGADGVVAANYISNVAPRDGSVLITVNNAMPFYQATGHDGVRYRAEKLSWIGSFPQDTALVSVWYTTGVRSIEDAKKRPIVMGAIGTRGTMAGYPALLNSVFGTKFKIIAGYTSSSAVDLAIERGEVEGRGATTWSTFKMTKPMWIKEGKIVPILQIGTRKSPDLPNVPLLIDLAKTEEQKQLFTFISETRALGQPFAAPPDIPKDRLEALRAAFMALGEDEGFAASVLKVVGPQSETRLIPGAEVEKIVRDTVNTPPALANRANAAMRVR